MEIVRAIVPPFVVLGFHPLLVRVGEFWGGPDVPSFLMFIWSSALALAVVKMYFNLRRKNG